MSPVILFVIDSLGCVCVCWGRGGAGKGCEWCAVHRLAHSFHQCKDNERPPKIWFGCGDQWNSPHTHTHTYPPTSEVRNGSLLSESRVLKRAGQASQPVVNWLLRARNREWPGILPWRTSGAKVRVLAWGYQHTWFWSPCGAKEGAPRLSSQFTQISRTRGRRRASWKGKAKFYQW